MNLKASVIVPTKNPGSRFQAVIDAVLTQETDFDYEVLVIDSGTDDGSLGFLSENKDLRLRLYHIQPQEFGHGRTRNLGISLTSGNFCVLITQDACPTNTQWLSNLVETADSNPEIAGVFGRHIAYPDADPFTARELDLHFSYFASSPFVRLDDPDRYARDQQYREILHFFSDNNALVRRSVWEKIPYPDVDFAEDQLWAKNIIEAGYIKGYAHDAAVYHSHDYSFVERFQRSFDESDAFLRLFGYNLCPSGKHFFRSWMALNRRDMMFVRERDLWFTHPAAALSAPIDNLMRLAGHYLGARGGRLPEWMRIRVSRDKRMLAGLSKTGKLQ